jgi:hypothetical protein
MAASWDELLPEKTEELRELFHTFLESGGTVEECVGLLNESLGYMGIRASVKGSSRNAVNTNTNRIRLPSNEELAALYANRNSFASGSASVSASAEPGYRTPTRAPMPIPRGFTTPSGRGTPFSPPPPKRKRNNSRVNRFESIFNSPSSNRRSTRKK